MAGNRVRAKDPLRELPDTHDLTHLETALGLVAKFELAVDGGAHRGIWTRVLAHEFEQVIAFEPWPDNADKNEWGVMVRAALGDTPGTCAIAPGPENTGQYHVVEGDRVPVVRLDDFDLPACDFLKLDIEGYEYFALKGAERTIDKYRPVILLEINGLCDRYGVSKEDIDQFLGDYGYQLKLIMRKDCIYCTR